MFQPPIWRLWVAVASVYTQSNTFISQLQAPLDRESFTHIESTTLKFDHANLLFILSQALRESFLSRHERHPFIPARMADPCLSIRLWKPSVTLWQVKVKPCARMNLHLLMTNVISWEIITGGVSLPLPLAPQVAVSRHVSIALLYVPVWWDSWIFPIIELLIWIFLFIYRSHSLLAKTVRRCGMIPMTFLWQRYVPIPKRIVVY